MITGPTVVLRHTDPIEPPTFGMAGIRMMRLQQAVDQAMHCGDDGSMSLFENRNSRPTREWDLGGGGTLRIAEIDQGDRYDLSVNHVTDDGSMFRLHVDDVVRQERDTPIERIMHDAKASVDLAMGMLEDPAGVGDPSLDAMIDGIAEAAAGAAWQYIDRLDRTDIKQVGVVMRVRLASPWSETTIAVLDEDGDSLGLIGPRNGFLGGRAPLPQVACMRTTRTITTLSPVTVDLRHGLLARMRAIAAYDRLTGMTP